MSWTMPDVHLGQGVLWYPGGDGSSEPAAALVTKIDAESICLTVFGAGYHNGYPKDGVRHKDDPRATPLHKMDNGTWTHNGFTARILKLMSLSRVNTEQLQSAKVG